MMVVGKEADKYALRLPNGLRECVKKSAHQNGRSMNSEIVFHLMKAFSTEPETQKADAQA